MTPLVAGERMGRAEFHARYLLTPEKFHAELVGGVVHLPGRKTWFHGTTKAALVYLLGLYRLETPGVKGLGRVTILLDDENEVEPDGCLYIDFPCQGQVRDVDGYLAGAPEFMTEIADLETEELDSVAKLRAYEKAGVREYLLILGEGRRVRWFVREADHLVEQEIPADGVLRSGVFPGFWLDTVGLLGDDLQKPSATLQRGLATPEHAAFVSLLASRRTGSPS